MSLGSIGWLIKRASTRISPTRCGIADELPARIAAIAPSESSGTSRRSRFIVAPCPLASGVVAKLRVF
jgi:hypothetical protein